MDPTSLKVAVGLMSLLPTMDWYPEKFIAFVGRLSTGTSSSRECCGCPMYSMVVSSWSLSSLELEVWEELPSTKESWVTSDYELD